MNEERLKGILIAIFTPIGLALASAIGVGVLLYDSIFVKIIYNMFIPNIYSLPEITYFQACALSLVVSIVFGTTRKTYKNHKEESSKYFIGLFVRPLFLLLFAKVVVKIFM